METLTEVLIDRQKNELCLHKEIRALTRWVRDSGTSWITFYCTYCGQTAEEKKINGN